MPHANQRVAYGQALIDAGRVNDKIVVLDADLGGSTMGKMFETEFPGRHLEVGIAEANMTSMAAGLALVGKIPFTNSFAVFSTGRSYDQIRQSVAIGNVNVKICGSSAGLSDFGDGATHQSVEDIATMRALPNITVICPADPNEAYRATLAAVEHVGPVYLRISRADYESVTPEDKPFVIGEPVVMKDGTDVAVLATGYMVGPALKAAAALEGRVSVKVVNIHTIKPLDAEKVLAAVGSCKAVVTAEEHSIVGGLGSAVAEAMRGNPKPTEFIGVRDEFGRSAHNFNELMEHYELTPKAIEEAVLKMNK
ncbi:MAG: transketolase family protein [Defluviitaleaceae bacterium]|nr:transketolase family protein [Defluviitaleaceae bacterium]